MAKSTRKKKKPRLRTWFPREKVIVEQDVVDEFDLVPKKASDYATTIAFMLLHLAVFLVTLSLLMDLALTGELCSLGGCSTWEESPIFLIFQTICTLFFLLVGACGVIVPIKALSAAWR